MLDNTSNECLHAAQEEYLVIKKLSQGVDGKTYLIVAKAALKDGLRDPTAIRDEVRVLKVLQTSNVLTDFDRETSICKRLGELDPFPFVEHIRAGRRPYIALQWIQGPTIYDYHGKDNNRFPVAYMWSILADLLEAALLLRHDRRHPYIHSDLHQNSIMLDFGNTSSDRIPQAKVIDFSRAIGSRDSQLFQRHYDDDLKQIGKAFDSMYRSCSNRDKLDDDRAFRRIRDDLLHHRSRIDHEALVRMMQGAQSKAEQCQRRDPSSHRSIARQYAGDRLLSDRTIKKAVDAWRQKQKKTRSTEHGSTSSNNSATSRYTTSSSSSSSSYKATRDGFIHPARGGNVDCGAQITGNIYDPNCRGRDRVRSLGGLVQNWGTSDDPQGPPTTEAGWDRFRYPDVDVDGRYLQRFY